MNKRLIGVLVFALFVSGIATLVLYRMISAQFGTQNEPPKAVLLVAARDLNAGTLLKESDIKETNWPGTIPANAISSKTEIVERGVISAIYAGEPFIATRLAEKGAGAGLAATIPAGKRAVAIRVNDVTSVAGFVTPGMRVDVLILGTPPTGSQSLGTQTRTLLQNMEVLSAGQQIERDKEGKPVSVPVVNMLVTPEQAEILSLASQDARIQLVLRNPLDTAPATPPGTAMAHLWTGLKRPPQTTPVAVRRASHAPAQQVAMTATPNASAAPAPRQSLVVQVLHGAQAREVRFDAGER